MRTVDGETEADVLAIFFASQSWERPEHVARLREQFGTVV